MSDPMEQALQKLRSEYLKSLPSRLEELRADIADFGAGQPAAADSLKVRLHRLAGSAGSYGFPDLGSMAREAQRLLADAPARGGAEQLKVVLDRMARAVEEAGK